ncbi:hypothetical protein CVT26_011948 [Gymnopilus dilepis]|uniref:MARVEL domain-containing protein n=1 Tax=Gymnopilus dilepis TaxID=231916 RepID=A0A409VYF8_9AGAR|nr:hypothetical protein CVT26_011948 [Gymnopilus dilepis]
MVKETTGTTNAPVARRSHIGWSYPSKSLMSLILAFSAVELGLSAWLTARYNTHHTFTSHSEKLRVRYILFASIWTFLIGSVYFWLFLLAVAGLFTSIASHTFFLFLTWVIWILAAAFITSTLGGDINCSNNVIFAYCEHLHALMGFAWTIVALLTVLLLLVVMRGRKRSRGDGYGYRGPLHANQTV